MNRLLTLYLILSYLSLFNVGCSILHPESLKKQDGYYTKHLQSCGPEAAQKATMNLRGVGMWYEGYVTPLEVGRDIQDSGGNVSRLLLSLFHYKTMEITFPYEMKRYFEKQGFKVTEIESLDSLDSKENTAVVLVRGSITSSAWHWLCFPQDDDIEHHFGKDTKIHLILLIEKD